MLGENAKDEEAKATLYMDHAEDNYEDYMTETRRAGLDHKGRP